LDINIQSDLCQLLSCYEGAVCQPLSCLAIRHKSRLNSQRHASRFWFSLVDRLRLCQACARRRPIYGKSVNQDLALDECASLTTPQLGIPIGNSPGGGTLAVGKKSQRCQYAVSYGG